MNSLLSDGVRVKIFGREYEMDAGSLTPLEIESLARFVDERMRDIAEKSSIVDTQKIAVLAAVNIALDYLQLREQSIPKSDALAPELERMQKILDGALNSE